MGSPPYLLPSLSWVSLAAAGDGRGNWRRRVADLALKRVRSATDGSTLFPELMMMAFPLTSPSRSSSSSASSSVHPEAGLYSVSSSSSSSHPDDVLLFPSASHPESGLYSVSSASSESNPDAMLTSSASHPDTVFIPSASHPDAVLLFPSASSSSASASPLEDPSDWDLASIESSLSPDPDLDQLFCMDLDPLLLAASESVIIRYQFDSDFFPPSSSSSSSLPPEYDGDHCVDQQDDQLRKQRAQACRNAQIALAMSPIRQYQAKLQAAQRRGGHQQQRAKRKFSLKNGATNVGGKTERSAGAATVLNNSVRRWQKEIGQLAICRNGPKRAQQKKNARK